MKEKKESKTKVMGFRIPRNKEELLKKRIKSTGKSSYQLLEDGILINESSNKEANLIAKKRMLIAERDEYLRKASDNNLKIEAYNKQLKSKYSRYKDLSEEDNVINPSLFKKLINIIGY